MSVSATIPTLNPPPFSPSQQVMCNSECIPPNLSHASLSHQNLIHPLTNSSLHTAPRPNLPHRQLPTLRRILIGRSFILPLSLGCCATPRGQRLRKELRSGCWEYRSCERGIRVLARRDCGVCVGWVVKGAVSVNAMRLWWIGSVSGGGVECEGTGGLAGGAERLARAKSWRETLSKH